MECNAPVTETVDGGYACVDCGRNPFADRSNSGGESTMDATTVAGTSVDEASAGRASPDETTVDETAVDERGSDDGSPLEDTGLEDDAPVEEDSGQALGVEN